VSQPIISDVVDHYRQKIEELERENAALRHSEENLASTVRGLEFELEKADAALDWLNTHCMSADPIMGRSTYRWTIEHDEPDIRAAIDAARANEGGAS
jgi:multidrug resistance efflux pump